MRSFPKTMCLPQYLSVLLLENDAQKLSKQKDLFPQIMLVEKMDTMAKMVDIDVYTLNPHYLRILYLWIHLLSKMYL